MSWAQSPACIWQSQQRRRRGVCRIIRQDARQLPGCNMMTVDSAAKDDSRNEAGYERPDGRSFEFEDLPNRTQPESGGSGSEENIYEDILDPSRENPYEDVAEMIPGSGLSDVRCPVTLSPTCLSQTRRPLNVSGPTMSDPLRRAQMRFNPHCNAHSSPSNLEEFNMMELPTTNKLVQKINSVFTAKRGKKRWKKYSVSSPESCSMKGGGLVVQSILKVGMSLTIIHELNVGSFALYSTDENSDSESDSDERLKEHTVRLAHMASLRRNLRGQRTLERELLERQQRQLFEYFVVVALRKKAHTASCLPELTYQFPKLERLTKEVREAEERLRAIPQFCFPDAKEWSPLTDFPSETFSFVLTYEDGTRRFGYCRRLLPSGKGPRLPEVYCIISRLGCFNLFSTILDEVEKRRQVSSALVYPFMRALLEATVPAPGRSIRVKSFMPDSGNEGVELRRPADSRLEHIDFSCLLSCLGTRHLLRLFASLLLERRVILTADKLSTLSKCGHAIVALLYPFIWQHTYIPVLPVSMLDIVCAPTPFLIGLLSSALPRLHSLPIEEVLVVDLCSDRFLKQMEDEDSILPRKLHSAMEHLLDQMEEIVTQEAESSDEEEAATPTDGTALDMLVSETFVRFFVEVLGHYSLHMSSTERGERTFQRESFRKSVASKSIRRFLEVFMQTQMFAGFVHDRELRKAGVRGLFELRAAQFLEENSEAELSGVNKFLKGLGNKMRFLSKKY
uniref:UDENN domain-containing protein n=1 Tax=Eptatretus burgeri TaxID=7764 RepID=A0A8C4RB59_EPTBU